MPRTDADRAPRGPQDSALPNVSSDVSFDLAFEGLAVHENGTIVAANQALAAMLGYAPAELIGLPLTRLVAPESREPLLEQDPHAPERPLEVTVVRKDGSTFPGETHRKAFTHAGRSLHVTALRDTSRRKRVEATLHAQRQLFENLVTMARAATEFPTLEATLRNVLEVAIRLGEAQSGSLLLLDKGGTVTRSLSVDAQAPAEIKTLVAPALGTGLAGWVARHYQAALIADTRQDRRWVSTSPAHEAVRAALAVPLLSGPALLGVLTLVHAEPGHFTAEHLHLMQAATHQMALAMRNAQIFDKQQRMADRQTTMYEVLRAVSGWLGPDALAQAAVKAIAHYTGWSNVSMAVQVEGGPPRWVVRAAAGELSPPVGASLPMGQGVIGRAMATGQTQLVPDVSADPDYVPVHAELRSELAVPLAHGERILGVLNLESDQPDAFDADDISLAGSLADVLALALDNTRLYQDVVDERGRLQALIESNRDGVVLIGVDGIMRVVNAPALHLLQLPGRPEDWQGLHVRAAITALRRRASEVVAVLRSEMRRARQGDEVPGEGEYELPPRTLHWLNLPVLAGNAPLGRLIVLRDVTEERLVEKMRDDLTHTMVHDLRSPLAAIHMAIDVLVQDAPEAMTADQRLMLSVAHSGTWQMLGLVNGILDISRLESGRMPLDCAMIALPALVEEVLQGQAPVARAKHLELVNQVPPELPLAWADAGLLRRVLQNLVGNAIKFIPAGGAIRVGASAAPDGLGLHVADNGPGIPAELQERLFQKFVTGRHASQGSGLGLVFCRLAIEAHGGRIWVESEPGQGTTFRVWLPGRAPKTQAGR